MSNSKSKKNKKTFNIEEKSISVDRDSASKGTILTEEKVKEMIAEAKVDVLKNANDEANKKIQEEIVKAEKFFREEINKQVQTDKASLITVFGIFASIISFLTIEFQFLKTVCSWQKILGFSCVLFALLFGFNVALDYLVKSRLDKETQKPQKWFSLFVASLFVFGVIVMVFGNEEICRENQIHRRYSEEFEKFQYDFSKKYEQKTGEIASEIKQLNGKLMAIHNKIGDE